MLPFDRIVAVNDTPVSFFDQINDIGAKNKNGTVDLQVVRNNDTLHLSNKVNKEGRLELAFLSDDQYDSLGVYKGDQNEVWFF